MQNNSQNISREELEKLANSPAGQQLMTLLQQTEGNRMQLASDQAAKGNYDALKTTLEPLLRSPKIQELLKQLRG